MAEKLNGDEKSNTITPNEFLAIQTELRAAQRDIDAATGRKRTILKRAKGQGADLDAIALLQRFAKMDDDEAAAVLRNTIRYASWLEVSCWTQAEMFRGVALEDGPSEKAKWDHTEARAYDDGYHEGKDANPIENNPHQPGGPLHQKWVTGWHDGQAANAPAQADGIEKASTKRKPRAEAEASAPA